MLTCRFLPDGTEQASDDGVRWFKIRRDYLRPDLTVIVRISAADDDCGMPMIVDASRRRTIEEKAMTAEIAARLLARQPSEKEAQP